MEENESPVVLLDGLEYLITQHNFNSILKLIQTLSEYSYLFGGAIFIPMDPYTIEAKEMRLLSQETTELALD